MGKRNIKSKQSKGMTLGANLPSKNYFTGKKVVYKGKVYTGSINKKGRIVLVPSKGPFKKLRIKDISGKPHVVTIPEDVYGRLKNVVPKGKVEAVGTLRGLWIGGEKEHLITSVKDFDLVSSSMTATKEKTANPTAGSLLNPSMKKHIKSKAVGQWHSHPTRDRISPADRKEFRKAAQEKELGSSSQVQLITRDKSVLPWGKKSRPIEPLAYFTDKKGKIHDIPVVVRKKKGLSL